MTKQRGTRHDAGDLDAAFAAAAGRIITIGSFRQRPTIDDFVAGDAGDRLDDGDALIQLLGARWDHASNLFADGYLKLRQAGADVVLLWDYDLSGKQLQTLLTFSNTDVHDFTAYNSSASIPRAPTRSASSRPEPTRRT